MKRLLATLLVAGVVSFVASSPTAAQSSDAAIVKIPFQFIAGGRVLPSGSYRIDSLTADWGVIRLTGLGKEPVSAYVSTENAGTADPMASKAKVQFVSYHGQYFLQLVAVPGRDARLVTITPGTAERTLAKLNLLNDQPAASAR